MFFCPQFNRIFRTILTGGTVISEELGLKLEQTDISQLGQVKSVKIDKDNTTLVDGAGDKKAISDRVAEIKAQIEKSTSDYDKVAGNPSCKDFWVLQISL